MNQKKNRRIFILGFFALIWIFLISYGYKRYQELHNQSEKLAIFNEQFKFSENINSMESSHSELSVVINEYDNQQDDGFFGKIANADENSFFNEYRDHKDSHEISSIDIENTSEKDKSKLDAKMCGEFPCYTGEQFIGIYEDFENNLNLEKNNKQIYYNKDVDAYIKNIAETLGYKERVFADERDLVAFLHMRTQEVVRSSYILMRNEMKSKEISLHLVSAYRNDDSQRNIFKRKMGEIEISEILSDLYDKKIKKVLTRSAIPGYSKHHSGYAVDFGCSNDYLVYSFSETECYDWMSENNFENSKRFGFIPSYPEGVLNQGPNPEPWEFVWVGIDSLK